MVKKKKANLGTNNVSSSFRSPKSLVEKTTWTGEGGGPKSKKKLREGPKKGGGERQRRRGGKALRWPSWLFEGRE